MEAIKPRSPIADSATKQTPPGKLVGHFARHLQGEPRLPDAARTGEGHELHVRAAQELTESSRFAFASNECGALHRQVVGARLRIPGRRIGEAVAHRGEVASQIPGGGVTLLRVLGQAALHDPNEGSGRLQHSGTETLGLIAKDCGRRFRMRLLSECGRFR